MCAYWEMYFKAIIQIVIHAIGGLEYGTLEMHLYTGIK